MYNQKIVQNSQVNVYLVAEQSHPKEIISNTIKY